ncbi:MAG: hypothetical protein Harvfovirus41_15, partial [Harvfovirus sp.]
YQEFREVTCLDITDCGSDPVMRIKSNECVKIKDPSGKEFILPFLAGCWLPFDEQRCYTDGQVVRKESQLGMALLCGVIYLLVMLSCNRLIYIFWPVQPIYPGYRIKNDLGSIMGCMILTYLLSAIIIFLESLISYKVSCDEYVSDGIYQPIDRVKWHDSYGTSQVGVIASYSGQPNVLPHECWIYENTIVFRGPMYFLELGALMLGFTCGVILLWLGKLYLDENYEFLPCQVRRKTEETSRLLGSV